MNQTDSDLTWINPFGGLGDTLMLSGVLKLHHDTYKNIKYNLIRRTKYLSILKGHPAINKIGFPPKDAKIIKTDYWSHELFGKNIHAFDILTRIFNLEINGKKPLYFPGKNKIDPIFETVIPWKKHNILFAPSSDSPRKEWPPVFWERLIARFDPDKYLFIEIGTEHTPYIRGAYSLLNVTIPEEVVPLAKKCDLIITPDNFLMHVAQLVQVPAIVLWGPTFEKNYGYEKQIHLFFEPRCFKIDNCIGPKQNTYAMLCDLSPEQFCLGKISVESVANTVEKFFFESEDIKS